MPEYYTSNALTLATSYNAPCNQLKRCIFFLQEEAMQESDRFNNKYKGPIAEFSNIACTQNPHPQVFIIKDPMHLFKKHRSRTHLRMLVDIGKGCPYPYHGKYHSQDIVIRGEIFCKKAIDLQKMTQVQAVVIYYATLLHDKNHSGRSIHQSKEYNISNEEISALDAYNVMYDQGYSPNLILATISCILDTSFGQAHLKDETVRKYNREVGLECLVPFLDIAGWFYKTGYNNRPFEGFMRESFALLEEQAPAFSLVNSPNFDKWLSSTKDFLKFFVEPTLTAVIEMRIFDNAFNLDIIKRYDKVSKELSDMPESLYGDFKDEFESIMRHKSRLVHDNIDNYPYHHKTWF